MAWQRIRGVLSKVHEMYGRNLLLANTASSGGLLLIGDMLEQKREGHKSIDTQRSSRMLAVGLSQGPPHHYFYLWLDKYITGKTRQAIVKKILIDQIFAAPFFAFTFIYGASLLEGRTFNQCWTEFKSKFPAIYLFDWLIWPPCQFINFSLVPSQYRVLYINFITVIWDIFLSYIKHREGENCLEIESSPDPASATDIYNTDRADKLREQNHMKQTEKDS